MHTVEWRLTAEMSEEPESWVGGWWLAEVNAHSGVVTHYCYVDMRRWVEKKFDFAPKLGRHVGVGRERSLVLFHCAYR